MYVWYLSIASMDPDTLAELKLKLRKELGSIIKRYGTYVRHIRETLKARGVRVKDLCSDLKTVSAFNHTAQDHLLLSTHEDELKRAIDFNDVFDLLNKEYASFLNYEIFKYILDTYHLDDGREEFKYPEYLKAYVEKHKVCEFVIVNPQLQKLSEASKPLTIKLDIDSTSKLSKLSKLLDLKSEIANILDLKPVALQLVDIKDGCLILTFLIPAPVADHIFNKLTIFSKKRTQQFQALKVLWLECNGCKIDFFTARDLSGIDCKQIHNPPYNGW